MQKQPPHTADSDIPNLANIKVKCASPRFPPPTTPSAAETPTAGAQRKIGIAVDLSDQSAFAVKWAVHHYLRPGDAVILLHVRPTSVLYGADWGSVDLSIVDTDNEESQKKLEDDFDAFTAAKSSDLAQPLVEAQIPYKIHIVKDHDMKERLCLEVERLGLSAVIMGSRGFGAIRRGNDGRLGSVSDYCVRHCVCPVVVVRYTDLKDGGNTADKPVVSVVSAAQENEEEGDYHGDGRQEPTKERQTPLGSAAIEAAMEKEAESRLKRGVLEKVGQVIASIKDAKHVDQVICALHSLALRLFPLDSHSLTGSVNEQYREQLASARPPATHERNEWWQVFYKGPAFATFARILLYDVAYDWLACLPISARMHVYDVFFLRGQVIEVVKKLGPCLQWRGSSDDDTRSVHSNAERLLVLCLLDNMGVTQIARELSTYCQEDLAHEELKQIISQVVQLLTSIPDKAHAGTPNALSSHVFFKHITAQLLAGAHEWDKLLDGGDHVDKNNLGGGILLMGEAFARICRRGSADVLLSIVVPEIHKHVQSFLPPNSDIPIGEAFQFTPGLRFWLKMIGSIKDPYSLERMTEQLLKQLAAQNTGDIEAHWILWILFHQVHQQQASIRSMFLEKFLLWKVFPSNCLRWILHFAVFQCSPENSSSAKACNLRTLSETVQRLVTAWSKREFVQSTSIEQQAYITAALGLCLEKMSKEDLDATKDAMHCILEGVSCRLGSADHLIRKMASSVALAFSKVIDPQNPLYLDDSCREEAIGWDFGLLTPEKRLLARSTSIDGDIKGCSTTVAAKVLNTIAAPSRYKNVMSKKKLYGFESVDPDEIIDPASLNNEVDSSKDDEDNASETSESSNDSSLQPYDLSDDDADLKRNFSQLVDVIGALRKSDDADGVDKAIDVAEKLVRASPDELKFVASDLTRSLIQVRCSDSTIEGEEESAEEKRQKALVALIVTCPHESLSTLNKLLYSPNLDVSQRLMILDVMMEGAQELANTRISRHKQRSNALVSSMADQAWFMPKPIGPPGAGPWKEISTPGTPLNWSHSYERELPPKSGQIKRGKTRRWSLHSALPVNQLEWSQNKFPQYAAAFMLPAMEGFDKKRHGVDLLGRDFIVLGKFIYMLGVCMKCSAMHPEASILASPLLELLRSREISHHVEAYVRRSVLFTASCILISLHPSSVAAALVEGNSEISKGLEWVRSWALHIAESDTDRECYTLAMTCLQLHAEMALQTSRALESPESLHGSNKSSLPSNILRWIIKIPNSSGGILSAP